MRRRSRLERALPRAVALMTLVLTMTVTVTPTVARADTNLLIEGRGFGHGVGMAQDGAFWLGRAGRSAAQILTTFYPGTTLSKRGGPVRVPLASASGVTLLFAAPGAIGSLRVPRGATVRATVRDGAIRVSLAGTGAGDAAADGTANGGSDSNATDGTGGTGPGPAVIGLHAARSLLRFFGLVRTQSDPGPLGNPVQVEPPIPGEPAPVVVVTSTTTTTVAVQDTAPPTTAPVGDASASSSTVVSDTSPAGEPSAQEASGADAAAASGALLEATSSAPIAVGGRRYRGSIELKLVGGGIRVTNVVDVEDYLRGMGEILTGSWPAAALQAQAIAARTYALRMMGSVGEVCPTQRCQVYLGAKAEYPQMDDAVAATRGKVVTYRGELAATYYSASGGGTIATPTEAFGAGASPPYLRAGSYLTGDLQSWTVSMSLGEVARRVGYRGAPSSVTITKVGPSGRALEVTVDGSSGPHRVGGPAFDAALGLKSTFFTIRVGTLAAPTAAPAGLTLPDGSGIVGPSGAAPDGFGADAGSDPLIFETTTIPGDTPAQDTAVPGTSGDAARAASTSPATNPSVVARDADVAIDAADASLSERRAVLAMGAAVIAVLALGVARRRRRRRSR